MPTKEKLESALRNAHVAGDQAAAKALANAIKTGQYDQAAQVGRGEAVQKGFVRGVEQALGGAAQKAANMRYNQLNQMASKLDADMQSGAILVTNESLAEMDRIQSEAIRIAQDIGRYEQRETQARESYEPIQEARPMLSTVGNIGGQMAAIPIPGAQARLPLQIVRGTAEGGAFGYIQPTIGDESAVENAKTSAVFGGAAPLVLRPITQAAGAAYRGVTGQADADAQSAIKYAQEQQLPLMTSDISPPDTFAGKAAQSLAEKIPVAGTGGVRAEQQTARAQAVKSTSEQYGTPSEKEIIDSLIRKSDKIANAAGKRYTQISEQMAGSVVDPKSTISVIDSHLARLTRSGAIQNPSLVKILQSVKDDITAGAQDINLLRENRTKFRETIKGDSLATSDTEQRVIDSVYKAMTDDINNAVAEKLGTNAAASMKQVDAIWAREANEIKNTKLKNIFNKGKLKPEEASKMLFSNDKSEIKTLFSALDSTGRQNAKSAIIQRAFDKSEGSPDKFLSEMKRLKNQTNVFFRGQEGKDLNGLINYLEYTREAGKAAVTTKSGQETIQIGAPVAIMADIGATGGAGTAGVAGYGLLARAYESPVVRNILARMQGVEKGSTEFEKLAAKLEAELSRAATISTQADDQ